MGEFEFAEHTVLIAGAGCALGRDLALNYAQAGAQVVVMDEDEALLVGIAGQDAARIEPLRLDVMRGGHRQHLGAIWEAEPVQVLVQLQLLRHAERPALALKSVAGLIRQLAPALRAGSARVVYVYSEFDEDAAGQSITRACQTLVTGLRQAPECNGLRVNAIELSPDGYDGAARAALWQAVRFLTHPDGPDVAGAVLPLSPGCD